jgi:predicted ATPase
MSEHKQIKTNWIVITGGPCSGKTTVIETLRELGYTTTIEHARHYIDTQSIKGLTAQEIRRNKLEFQRVVLDMQIEEEENLDVRELVFLDRALPDAMAYYAFLGLDYDKRLIEKCNEFRYRHVFILDRLPLVRDYARLESEEDQKKIQELITSVYKSFPYPVTQVPVLPLMDRVNFILEHVKRQNGIKSPDVDYLSGRV